MNIGRLKFISERLRGYFSWGSIFMLLHLWVKDNGLSWAYVAPGIIVLAYLVWQVDKRFVAPGEIMSNVSMNPEWRELMEYVRKGKG